jgi:hypothetical protein
LSSGSPLVFAGGQLRVDLSNPGTGVLRLLDQSKLLFTPGAGSIAFAASAGETWAPGATLTVEGFDQTSHQLIIGDTFESITPDQRAAISFAGVPAFCGGNGQLRPASPYEQWALGHFPLEAGNPATETTKWGAEASPSGDGTTNVLKYALNLDPLASSSGQLPQAGINPEGYLQIAIRRNPEASDITYRVEVSENLTTWQSGETHTVTVIDEPALLVVRDATLFSETDRRFMRLIVTLEAGQ